MNLFGIAEAQYYCNSFARTTGVSSGSLRQHVTVSLPGVTSLREGTPAFNVYRDCALRDVDRLLFLGVSHYRRALDLMIASSAPWAYVTLYYGSYYVASALLGLFGGFIKGRTIIDVAVNAPGKQELRISRNATPAKLGSHQAFWDVFYASIPPLHPWVDPALAFALQPIAGSATWQIDNRNLINYDTYESCQLIGQFQVAFRGSTFPTSLPGVLNTQFRVFDGLLQITCALVRQFNFRTDGLSGFLPAGRRSRKIRTLVFREIPPSLLRRIRQRAIVV